MPILLLRYFSSVPMTVPFLLRTVSAISVQCRNTESQANCIYSLAADMDGDSQLSRTADVMPLATRGLISSRPLDAGLMRDANKVRFDKKTDRQAFSLTGPFFCLYLHP